MRSYYSKRLYTILYFIYEEKVKRVIEKTRT